MIFFDRINFNNYFFLIKLPHKSISVLEECESRLFLKILNYKKKEVYFLEYFAGDIFDDNQESISITASKIASSLSLNAFSYFEKRDNLFLKRFELDFDDDKNKLFYAKVIFNNLRELILKILVIKYKYYHINDVIYLESPKLFNSKILTDYFSDLKIHFYENVNFDVTKNTRLIINKILASIFTYIVASLFDERIKKNRISKIVFQSNTLGTNPSLRNEVFWIDSKEINQEFNTLILTSFSKFLNFRFRNLKILEEYRNKNIYVLPYFYNCLRVTELKKTVKYIFISFFCKNHRDLLPALFSFNLKKSTISYLISRYNVKLIIIQEPHNLFSDAATVASQTNNCKTICLQYSNLPFFTPLMTVNSNYYVIFSNLYQDVFKQQYAGPIDFIINGYLYKYVKNNVLEKSLKQRELFHKKGVKTIITYFDERVDLHKLGHVNYFQHLNEISLLLKLLINNSEIALVVKSQFTKYTPSKFYYNSKLFKLAIESGRYLELHEGLAGNRNDIYPMEASLISDISISHKFGATAGLESAIAGGKCVLINSHNLSCNFDSLYSQSAIVFENMESFIEAYFENYNSNIGDWTSIVKKFDNFTDVDSDLRLREIFKKAIYDT
jgi:hypothetical protein